MARKGDSGAHTGPEPERLKISGDPAEALDKLLGKSGPAPGEWHKAAEYGVWDPRRDVEVELDDGSHLHIPGESGPERGYVYSASTEPRRKVVRWRYLD